MSVLGTLITPCDLRSAVSWVDDASRKKLPTFVSCANVYSVVMGWDEPAYRDCVNSAGLVIPDGVPIVWALRALGYPSGRVHGDDLLLAFCREFPSRRHFLLGGSAGQPTLVARRLRREFPKICIAGTHATPVRPLPPEAHADAVDRIVESEAEIVWVGMGTPDQDYWMAAGITQISAPMVGVGSAFDMLAGGTRAAPGWMKASGTQWLFRLAQEPRRLWRRYATYNPRFLILFARQYYRHKSTIPSAPGEDDLET